LEGRKLALLQAAAKTKCPWFLMMLTSSALDLSESSDGGSEVDDNEA
jgi:hypothetical protein